MKKMLALIGSIILIISTSVRALETIGLDPDTPGLPKSGKILFGIGHDSPSLTRFKSEVLDQDPSFPTPDLITLYTNLVYGVYLAGVGANPFDEQGQLLDGFNLDTNDEYNFGVNSHNFTQSLSEYPDAALAVGLFLSDVFADCANVPVRTINAIFRDDIPTDDIPANQITAVEKAIDVMIEHFKSLDRVVYLRIGYEFDSKDQCYNPDYHVAAFRYIKERIDALGADKVATVWQAAGWPRDEFRPDINVFYTISDPGHYDIWYPGDEYVDFVGLSTFYMRDFKTYQWGCSDLNPDLFTETVAPRYLHNRILDFARSKNKPVMIAESAPQGFDTRDLSASCIFNNNKQSISAFELWRDWYKDFFKFVRWNRDVVRVVHYINSNWQDATTAFQCVPGGIAGQPDCPAGYWGDHTIQENPYIYFRFKHEISRGIYVKSRPQFLP